MNQKKLLNVAVAGLVAAGFALNTAPAFANHDEAHQDEASHDAVKAKKEAHAEGVKAKKMKKGADCSGKHGCKGKKHEEHHGEEHVEKGHAE